MHTARTQGCKSQWLCDKHNCPQRDSIPGPRALQSGMLPLDHCDLLRGLSLTLDATVATTLADSYISASASSAGTAAEMAESRKQAKLKYVPLSGSYVFQPIVLETLGPINESAVQSQTIWATKNVTKSLLSLPFGFLQSAQSRICKIRFLS